MSDEKPLNQRIYDLREDIFLNLSSAGTTDSRVMLVRWVKELAEILRLLEIRTR